ncbi:MAG: hypothetical protein KY429_06760 [Actinobacteria bacterium]|nr:hypothetical protein [Actinomycetota bacterium]
MGVASWLGRLFGRRRNDWDWGLPGAAKTFRSSDENISNLRPRVTYPTTAPRSPVPEPVPAESPAPSKILAEEHGSVESFQPQVQVTATLSGPQLTTPSPEEWWRESQVVLEFQDGRVALSSTDPMVKDFIRAADRMMRPRRRLFGKVGAP